MARAPADGTITDGRQSERALMIRRGTARRLVHLGFTPVYEWVLPNGRRADIAGLNGKGEILIVEVKSSPADFLSDQKWPEYGPYCDLFSFATSPEVPVDLFPVEEGLIIADQFGAEVIRDPCGSPLAASRRKHLIISLARTSASRLHSGDDPGAYRLS